MAKLMKSIRTRLPNGHVCDVKNIKAWMINRHNWNETKLYVKIPKITYETACICLNKLHVENIVRRVVVSCSIVAMSASLSFGLVSCSEKQPNEEIEYVVNANNPKTTEVQKEINQMLNVLGVFSATLQKKTVEKDGIVTNLSWYDPALEIEHRLSLNEELSSSQQTVYEEERFFSENETSQYYRRILTKADDGIAVKIKMAPGGEKPALDAPDDNWNVEWGGKYVLSGDKVKAFRFLPAETHSYSLLKKPSGSIEKTLPDGSYLTTYKNITCVIE